MTWVAYGVEDDRNGLFLAQFAEGLVKEEDMRTQWKDSMRQSGQNDWDDIEVEESDKVELTSQRQSSRRSRSPRDRTPSRRKSGK